MESQECQSQRVQRISVGYAKLEQPLSTRLKFALMGRLSPHTMRVIRKRSNDLLNRLAKLTGRNKVMPNPMPRAIGLKTGDVVRVRSREEVEATLDHWRQLKGCTFYGDMGEYCSTVQRVLKPVEQFIDERDYRMKKAKGIVLLEGVMCKGNAAGRCDRACFYFWREEWLEKV